MNRKPIEDESNPALKEELKRLRGRLRDSITLKIEFVIAKYAKKLAESNAPEEKGFIKGLEYAKALTELIIGEMYVKL